MNPGDEVRLRHNPTRRGVLRKVKERPSGLHWFVSLGGEPPGYVPESQLELVPEGPITPLDLLSTGEFAPPSELRRLLTHVRVSGHPADMLYSMEATNTDFKAYQFKPVIKILEAPTGRVLLADEVGLGKTIEAGLIWTELRSRFTSRRLLVLCPKSLREKWRRELRTKFGVEATITEARDLLERLRYESHDTPFCLIASTSSLILRQSSDPSNTNKTPTQALQEYLADATHHPCFDFLVVDEAHHGRNPRTKTHQLIKVATEASTYCALLSATPIHNGQRDLLSLLNLLDPDTFSDPEVLDTIRQANEPLIRARDALRCRSTAPETLAEHLDTASNHPLLSKSEQLRLIRRTFRAFGSAPPNIEQRNDLAYRLERVNLLGHVISRTRRRDVEEDRVHREVSTQSVPMNDREQIYYRLVTQAVMDYAEEHQTTHGFLLSQPQRQMASCFAASAAWFSRDPQQRYETAAVEEEAEVEEVDDDDHDDDIRRPLIAHLRRTLAEWCARNRISPSGLSGHLRQEDTKYDRLLAKLREYGANCRGRKLVLFSTFRTTIAYLADRLTEDGFTNTVLQGGQARSVDDILAEFQANDGPNILLSTEVGAEGVDLQFCSLLVNYDLPWNPMRVEQRIGRLDRIGQTADKIVIWTLLHEDTIDFRIHELLFEKLHVFHQYLGDCEEIVAKKVRELTRDLLSDRLNDEQKARRIEQTANAIEYRRRLEQDLENEAPGLTAYGDYILDRVDHARKQRRWLGSRDIFTYVTENLRRLYPGSRVHPNRNGSDRTRSSPGSEDLADLDLSPHAQADFSEFLRKRQLRTETRLATSAYPVRCRFTSRAHAARVEPEEVITQFHPITQFIAHLLNDPDRERTLRTVVSARLRKTEMPTDDTSVALGDYVLVVSAARFDGLRSTTHIKYAATPCAPAGDPLPPSDAERLASAVMSTGTSWLAARGKVDFREAHEIAERLFHELAERFDAVSEEENAANDDRVQFQVSAIDRQIERRHAFLSAQVQNLRNQADDDRVHGRMQAAARRENLVKATKTRLSKEVTRLRRHRESLLTKRRVRYNPAEELAVAVVRIE